MKNSLLAVKGLNTWYDREKMVLSNLSLELNEHEAVGLIGLNGAGKTTFLKVLSGLLSGFCADSILLCGRPANLRAQDFKRCRYTVFAEDNSFQYFTFREYLSYVFNAYGKELSDVSALVRGFHFENYMDTLLKDLSTGNCKKVFLITAFALKPKLLLLDEPVNGLDFQSTEYLYRLITDYKNHGTVLFSSHILESITLTSDRVFVLESGKISRTFEHGHVNAAEIREALHYENNF
ncbi:MAG: ABC transporter ATP-binding protein [Acetatifactor sp.]|nr:ABC transporter ATP-binding protein [Acetatifactor sp.]MDE7354541.1 ABC transporter ATP-binding protein [Acetatifactor sp.]